MKAHENMTQDAFLAMLARIGMTEDEYMRIVEAEKPDPQNVGRVSLRMADESSLGWAPSAG